MIGISLDIPEVACRGGVAWPPLIGGTAPLIYANFAAGRYWYSGAVYSTFAAWNTASGATFTRAGSATYLKSGVVNTATTDVPRFPTDASGSLTGLRMSVAFTELCLWNRDLTNAVWTATNATVVKDQVGADGVAVSASSITATAGNATVLQTITSAVNNRIFGAYVKRLSGSGTVNMTQDNGATWTPLTLTGTYTFFTLPVQSLTNPIVGFQIVNSGDSIAVDYCSGRVAGAAYVPDVIPTTTVTVTQPADNWKFTGAFSTTAETIAVGFNAPVLLVGTVGGIFSINNNASTNRIDARLGNTAVVTSGGVTQTNPTLTPSFTLNAMNRLAVAVQAGDFASSSNGGTIVATAPGAMPASLTLFELGQVDGAGAGQPNMDFVSFGLWPALRATNAQLQALATSI